MTQSSVLRPFLLRFIIYANVIFRFSFCVFCLSGSFNFEPFRTLELEKILCLMRLYCIIKIAGVSIKNSSKQFLEICKFSLLFGLLPQFR